MIFMHGTGIEYGPCERERKSEIPSAAAWALATAIETVRMAFAHQTTLIPCSIKSDHPLIDPCLIRSLHPDNCCSDLTVDRMYSTQNSLS